MKTFTSLLIAIISLYNVSGQVNSDKISYTVRAKKRKIEYRKINNLSDFDAVKKKELPLFLFDSLNVKQIKTATSLVEKMYLELTELKNNDSIAKAIKAEYENITKAQEDRVLIYKEAYEKVKDINQELNTQLDVAIDIGRKSAKRNKLNNVVFGMLGGMVTGITIGVLVSN